MSAPADQSQPKRAKEIARALLDTIGEKPRVAMLLGTGHSSLSGRLTDRVSLSPQEQPEGLIFAGDSHLLFGRLEGVPILIGNPPLAPYDGPRAEDITLPIRVFAEMGVELLVLTAGASSLTQQLEPGSLAVVEDHLNFSDLHPLQGPHQDDFGPRFRDMSEPYSMRWLLRARKIANDANVTMLPAVFAAVPGPSLPTRAEYRFLRRAGADLVGMSLVPETLTAVHCGLDVLALCGITQRVRLESQHPTDLEEMLDAAELAGPRMASVLTGVVASLA